VVVGKIFACKMIGLGAIDHLPIAYRVPNLVEPYAAHRKNLFVKSVPYKELGIPRWCAFVTRLFSYLWWAVAVLRCISQERSCKKCC